MFSHHVGVQKPTTKFGGNNTQLFSLQRAKSLHVLWSPSLVLWLHYHGSQRPPGTPRGREKTRTTFPFALNKNQYLLGGPYVRTRKEHFAFLSSISAKTYVSGRWARLRTDISSGKTRKSRNKWNPSAEKLDRDKGQSNWSPGDLRVQLRFVLKQNLFNKDISSLPSNKQSQSRVYSGTGIIQIKTAQIRTNRPVKTFSFQHKAKRFAHKWAPLNSKPYSKLTFIELFSKSHSYISRPMLICLLNSIFFLIFKEFYLVDLLHFRI